MTVNSLAELDALIAASKKLRLTVTPGRVACQNSLNAEEPAAEPRNRHERRRAAALARRKQQPKRR